MGFTIEQKTGEHFYLQILEVIMSEHFEERKKVLRKKAEKRISKTDLNIEDLSKDQLKALIEDYQLYQIELEIQNEELRDAQIKLQQTRDRFAKLYNEAPVGYLTIDPNGIVLLTNQTFADMAGKNPDQISGKAMADLIFPEDRSSFHGRFRAFFKNPYNKQLDFRLSRKQGSIWVRCTGRIEDDIQHYSLEGQSCLLMAVNDVSKQIVAEKKLQESEDRFRLLSDLTMEGIVIHKAGMVRDFNKSLSQILGYKQEELLGQNLLQLAIHDEDKDIVRSNIVKEYASPYVVRAVRKNGEVFYAELEARNFPAGSEMLRVAAVRDITERKKAEDALRESEKMFKTLFMESPLAIFIHDRDSGEIIDANPAVYSTYGYSSIQELRSKRFWVDSPYSFEQALVKIHKAANEGPQQFEWLNRKKNGDLIWEYVRLNSITINGTERILATSTDITHRKKAENEIKLINEQLEQANSQKDKLLSIIAHDLKSPMAGVFSISKILASDIQSLSQKEIEVISSEIHKSMENSMILLDDLMQWAQMSSGGMEFIPEKCDIHKLIIPTLDTARGMAQRKNIRIQSEIPEELNIIADQSMLNTVIRNLIFNAIKFTGKNGNILIKAEKKEAHVEVCIQDNGIGMNEKVLSSIFTVDQNKRKLGTEGEKGTGLGLILCKEFVEKHGGQIWIESEPEKGTKVFFTLPEKSDS